MVRQLLVLLFAFSTTAAFAQEDFDPFDPTDDDAAMGIEVGAKIPAFSAVDQHGEKWDFDRLKGPNGALLLFHRSADW